MLSGNTYTNVHSQVNAGGEIRGQNGVVSLQADLSGDQEVPPVITAATGSVTAIIDAAQTAILYSLSYADVPPSVQQAHIHVGAPGANGGITLFLCTNLANGPVGTEPACPSSPGTVNGILTATDFLDAGGVLVDFADAVNTVRTGGTYVNVHSTTNPGGEVRGQIPAAQ